MKIEIIKGVEGLCIGIDDRRICGPKPWGGGKVINSWEIEPTDIPLLAEFANVLDEYSRTHPDLLSALKALRAHHEELRLKLAALEKIAR